MWLKPGDFIGESGGVWLGSDVPLLAVSEESCSCSPACADFVLEGDGVVLLLAETLGRCIDSLCLWARFAGGLFFLEIGKG